MSASNRVEDIFIAALEKTTAEERAAYLDGACRGDPGLHRAVERLLEAHAQIHSFLERPACELDPTANSPPDEQPQQLSSGLMGSHIGPYKLLEKIGEGGMGFVYMADQQTPIRRRVALKVIKPGLDTRQVIARFEAERQALALMDHPNIARVIDAGTTEAGRPYFVMELVRGVSITDYCDQNNLPVHERLELFDRVCQAVQHAHQKGIIHRDLKPSNILVTMNDGRAVPKVIDFGIAKATNQQLTDKSLFTNFAQMVGTPLYMSPEQAEMTSLDVDTRTDIYSLGVLLYELLTGTTPFDRGRLHEAAYDEVRRIIREEVPPRPSLRISTLGQNRTAVAAHRQADPSRLGQLMRGDLDWIVMKALEKDRTRRYDTATGLAADVRRYLSDQPVEAGPPSAVYRFGKFARRNLAAIVTAASLCAMLILGTVASTWQAIRATQAERRADENAAAARASEQIARSEKQRADENANEAARRAEEANDERERAEEKTDEANAAAQRERKEKENHYRLRYIADMNFAQRAWDEALPNRTLKILSQYEPKLGEIDLRGWEWHYQMRLCQNALRTLSVEGRYSLVCSPDGARFAFVNGVAIEIWDVATGRLLQTLQDDEAICGIAYSPDGLKLVGRTDGKLLSWDVASGTKLHAFGETIAKADDARNEPRVSFSPDSKYIASPFRDRIILWDAATGNRHQALDLDKPTSTVIAFSPDGKSIACGMEGHTIEIWDIESGKNAKTLSGHSGEISEVAFSPDGKQLASGSNDGTIKLWSVERGVELRSLRGHTGIVSSVAYSKNGVHIASAGFDKTVRVWDARSGDEVRVLKGHSDWVSTVTFGLNDRCLISASSDGTVKIWDFQTDQDKTDIRRLDRSGGTLGLDHDPLVNDSDLAATFSADRRGIVLAEFSGDIACFNLPTGQLQRALPVEGHEHSLEQVLSPDGKLLAAVHEGPSIKLWNTDNGRLLRTLRGLEQDFRSVAFSPDGCQVMATGSNGSIRVWNAITGHELFKMPQGEELSGGVAVSPDGTSIASMMVNTIENAAKQLGVSHDPFETVVLIRDSTSGKVRQILHLSEADVHENSVLSGPISAMAGQDEIAYRPDGRCLALTRGKTIQLWNPLNGAFMRMLIGHSEKVHKIAFNPDGTRLASRAADSTLRLWDVDTGREVCKIRMPDDNLRFGNLLFSPDGRCLLATSLTRTYLLGSESLSDDEKMARFEVDHLFRKLASRAAVLREIERMSTWNEAMRDAATRYAQLWDDDSPGFLIRRGREASERRDWVPAAQALQEARSLAPRRFDTLFSSDLTTTLAMSGRWSDAAEAFVAGHEDATEAKNLPWLVANLRLAAGDESGYRAQCARMFDSLKGTDNRLVAHMLALSCSIGERAVDDMGAIVVLAQKLVDADPRNPAYRTTLGSAQFRDGQVDECIRTLQEAMPMHVLATAFAPKMAEAIQLSRVTGETTLALAYHAKGDRGALEKQIVTVRELIDRLERSPPKPTPGVAPWSIRFAILLSKRELAKIGVDFDDQP